MNLKEYEQKKFSLAEIVRSAQAIDTKDLDLQSASRDLLTRLADNRFNLMLVGRFSRGKSTLINAVLGQAYLPTGILPLTSVITTVRYGSRPQVVLNFWNSRMRREIPLSQLADYVTQQANPGNAKGLAYAEIELPVELLRRGLFFVDSPGLGSAFEENTETTERFFPEADAFVLITSYDSPLSEEENRALQRIRQADKVLFVIVNKQDTVTAAERGQVLGFMKERLAEYSFLREPQIFSVSARQAIEGKLSRRDELVDASGIRQFEETLLKFLIEERAEAFLATMRERISAFLAQRRRLDAVAEDQKILEGLSERLRGLRASAVDLHPEIAISPPGETDHRIAVVPEKRTGCRVCGQVLEAIFRFMSKHQYQLTIDSKAQQAHSEKGGFCSLHTWQYENISSPYGVCASYPALLHRMALELQEIAGNLDGAISTFERVNQLLASKGTCQVCRLRVTAERIAIDEAAARVGEVSRLPSGTVPACCLLHLAMLSEVLGKSESARLVLGAHAQFFERLGEDAQRYALRHDALRRYLTSEEERQASQLILLMLAGHRNVSAPWQVEYLL